MHWEAYKGGGYKVSNFRVLKTKSYKQEEMTKLFQSFDLEKAAF